LGGELAVAVVHHVKECHNQARIPYPYFSGIIHIKGVIL